MNPAIRRRQFGLVGFLAFVLIFMVGCGDLSDEPPPPNSGSGKLNVSLTELAQQLGYVRDPATGLHTTPTASDATTPVVDLVIGAMVVRSRTLADGPYSDSVPITNLETQLETDLLNSIGTLQLVQLDLLAGQTSISVDVPDPAATKWQFLAAGFQTATDGSRPQNLADLGEAKFQDSAIYFAFHPQFLRTSVSDQTVTIVDAATGAAVADSELTLLLRRACLISTPPKGCAQFNTDTLRTPTVTAAVEIVGVLVDTVAHTPTTFEFPLVVRSGGAGSCISGISDACTPAVAIQRLNTIPRANATNLIVLTTHQLSSSESTECRTTTVGADLLANCAIQSYLTTY